MDLQKKLAFIKWLNVLNDERVDSFSSLKDGHVIVKILQSCGEITFTQDLDTAEKRIQALKSYLEGFYHQSFDDGQLIDFNLLMRQNACGDTYEYEMGKLLLAILGCVIQDKCREKFITAALSTDEHCQHELKEMIENVLFMNNLETQLPQGFAEILKQKRVGSGGAGAIMSPRPSHTGTPGSTMRSYDPPVYAMYTNSPQGANTSGINIRDISSPLRVMSLSSPQTPLGALMHSPQLAQKIMAREVSRRQESEALLRQKMQEQRRLEIALRDEQHLRTELELDLRDRTAKIQEKDNRLREVERQLGELRRMRDNMDELDILRVDNEKLHRDIKELQTRVLEQHDIREQNQMLERENRDCLKELTAARDELKFLESSKTASDEYRVQYHRLQLSNSELSSSLEHREAEVARLREKVEEVENARLVCLTQRDSLRREKEELEEMYLVNQASVASAPLGESMNVVTEKRLAEVQAECEHIRASWIDPGQHEAIRQQLSVEQQTKQSYEEKYFEARKKLMALEEKIENFNLTIRQSQARNEQLETMLGVAKEESRSLGSEVAELKVCKTQLEQSESELTEARVKSEARISHLEQELTTVQSQLEMNMKELHHERGVNKTFSKSLQSVEAEKQDIQQELHAQQLLNDKQKINMEHEVNVLNEKISTLEEDNKVLLEKVDLAKKDSSEQVSQLESLMNSLKETAEERLEKLQSLTEELEQVKTSSEAKIKDLSAQLQAVTKEKTAVDREVHKRGLELENTKTSFENKRQKLENKSKDTESHLTQKLEHLENSNKHLNEQCIALKKELKTSSRMIETQREENSVVTRELECVQCTATQISTDLENSRTKLMDYESQIAVLNKAINEEIESKRTLEKEKTDLIEQFNTKTTELSRQIQEQTEEFSKLQTGLENELSSSREDFESKLCALKQEHEGIVNKLKTELEEQKCETEKSLESRDNMLKECKCEISKRQSQIMELELSVKEKVAMLDTMSQQLDYLKSTEKSLTVAHTSLEADNIAMKNLIDQKNQAREELERVVSEKDAMILKLNNEIGQLKEHTEKGQSEHSSEIESLKSTLEEVVSKKDSEIVSLEGKLAQLGKESEQAEANFKTTLESVKADFENVVTEKNKEMSSHKEYLEELERVVSEKDAMILKLNNEIGQLKEHTEKGQSEYSSEIESLKSTLEEVVSKKDSEIVSLEEKLAQLGKESEQAEADFKTTIESVKADFENVVTEKNKEMTSHKEYLEQLKAEKLKQNTDNKAKMEAMKVSFENVVFEKDAELMTLKKEIAEVRSKRGKENSENRSQLETLQSSLETMTSNVEENENIITELKDKLVETESYWRSQCEELQEEYAKETQEQKDEMERQIEEVESKHDDVLLKLSNDKDIHVASLEEGYKQRMQGLERVISEKKQEIEKLQGTVEEQRVSYQNMMSGMEEKLNEEISNLNNRFSQMKCQYETMMETKEKETKKKLHGLTEKISGLTENISGLTENISGLTENITEMEKEKVALEEQVQSQTEEIVTLKAQIAELTVKLTDYEGMMSESNSLQAEREERIGNLETELAGVREELGSERGETGELQRQAKYMQDRNDTLSAELSSQQQQLAAVEEEKRQQDVQLASVQQAQQCSLEQLQQQRDTEHRHWNIEKMELENQLQSLQKSYNAVEKSVIELQSRLEEDSSKRARTETRCMDLERQLCATQQREAALKDDAESLRERNIKMNGQQELQKAEYEKLTTQLLSAQRDMENIHGKFEQETRALVEEKTILEIEAVKLGDVKAELAVKEEEYNKIAKINEQYKLHYNKKKEIIASLESQVKSQEQKIQNAKVIEDKYASKITPLQDKLNLEIVKNKSLSKKLQTLEVQNDLAERKLREYKQELSKSSAVFLGDPSDFQKLLADRENDADATFMTNYPSSVPLNDSLDSKKRVSSLDDIDSSSLSEDNTVIANTRASRRRMSKSTSSTTVASADNADTVSIGSATSLAYRLRSRESAASLNRSITSFDSCRSNASVPRGTGGIFHCEDEPLQLEWGRLGELSRRNTMCPNHLKTSYPVETQRYNPRQFRDNALRESTIGNMTIINSELTGSGKKRKQTWDTDSTSDSADGKNKLAKTGCVYQKPGPPTPANSRRNSKGSNSKSPSSRRSSKGSRSPKTPLLRNKRTPHKTPRRTPQSAVAMDTSDSGRQASRRESVAFSVGFSPVSNGRPTRLSRQRAFIQKQPQASSQMPVRKPLGVRNYHQTGV